jgi:hypothetical protein
MDDKVGYDSKFRMLFAAFSDFNVLVLFSK